jgi:hypothetical protein
MLIRERAMMKPAIGIAVSLLLLGGCMNRVCRGGVCFPSVRAP